MFFKPYLGEKIHGLYSHKRIFMITPKIYILIDDKTCLRYFAGIIALLLAGRRHKVLLISRQEELAEEIKNYFSPAMIHVGYTPNLITSISPDLIICNQLWWWGITPFLQTAVNLNIPILQYDHGSLIYTNPYFLMGDEGATRYRSEVYLCSHIACWGQRAKDCWVSYSIPEEKIFLTGAMHLDHLFAKVFDERIVKSELGIPRNKKIIFCYTAFTGQRPEREIKLTEYMQALEHFVESCPDFHLVVKPHPSEMLWFDAPRYPYSPNTTLIANEMEDCHWERILRFSPEDVIAISSLVVSPASSALTSPLSLNVPIVILNSNSPLDSNFASYCSPSVTVSKSAAELAASILNAIQTNQKGLSDLAHKFNYGNDGKATERFMRLIHEIIEDKLQGAVFYQPEILDIEQCIRRYPFFPYPYYRMIKFNCAHGNDLEVDRWLSLYCSLFNDPFYILQELLEYYLNVCRDLKRVIIFIEHMLKYKPRDFQLLHLYKEVHNAQVLEKN